MSQSFQIQYLCTTTLVIRQSIIHWFQYSPELSGNFIASRECHENIHRCMSSNHRGLVRHIMMTSSNGNIFRVTGHLCGEFTGPGEFPAQRPVTRSFDVFFDLRPDKRLSKPPRGWWFETPSWSLWRQCNEVYQWVPAGSNVGATVWWLVQLMNMPLFGTKPSHDSMLTL